MKKNNIKKICNAIKMNFRKHVIATTTHTESIIKQGKLFLKLKKAIKGTQDKFEDLRQNEFPYISKKKAERYCQIAKHIYIDNQSLESHPNLALLGQVQLLDLIKIKKDIGIVQFIQDNDIDLDFDSSRSKHIREFHEQIVELLEKHKGAQKSKSGGTGKKNSPREITVEFKITGESLLECIDKLIKEERNLNKICRSQVKKLIRSLKDLQNQFTKNKISRK